MAIQAINSADTASAQLIFIPTSIPAGAVGGPGGDFATSIATTGADEVPAAITALFNGHGQAGQDLANQAAAFQQQLTQLLASAATSCQQADVAAQNALRGVVTSVENQVGIVQLVSSVLGSTVQTGAQPVIPNLANQTFVVGGTDYALVSPALDSQISSLYGLPNPVSIFTPEQLWPITPTLGSLTLNQSVASGVSDLNRALLPQLAAGNQVTVWATSQGSTVLTGEIRNLMAQGSPHQGQLKFVLTGDPNNPDGGVFERFTGLYVPLIDATFNGATPPNSPYPTTIYTNQYDGVGDFPQYPLNVVSDVNALMGFILTGQHDYVPWSPLSYVQLPTSPGYTGNTTYYMSLTQNLPLGWPARTYLPAPYGNALADLLQPDARVIVDLGYGSGEYANIPTPASLLELPNPFTILPDLAAGTIQGAQAALVDLGVLPVSMYPTTYPFTPVLDPGLNFPLPQTGVTGLSLLSGLEGQLLGTPGLDGSWNV
ncbi:MAG TPA: PE-PPE domain-containing protein [Mycobacterium sp.]|nr:PE-PPE domain-containing protein [Mycobacterium sp.]